MALNYEINLFGRADFGPWVCTKQTSLSPGKMVVLDNYAKPWITFNIIFENSMPCLNGVRQTSSFSVFNLRWGTTSSLVSRENI